MTLLSGTITVIDVAKTVVPSTLVQSIFSTLSNIATVVKVRHCRMTFLWLSFDDFPAEYPAERG